MQHFNMTQELLDIISGMNTRMGQIEKRMEECDRERHELSLKVDTLQFQLKLSLKEINRLQEHIDLNISKTHD